MSSADQFSDIPIKDEPTWPGELLTASPLQSSSKRRLSGTFETPAEKRQRVSVASDAPLPDDFAAIIARAAATVAEEANQVHTRDEKTRDLSPIRQHESYAEEENHFAGIVFDAHLNMRILSLPILESLSIQILATLASGSYNQAIDTVTRPESESGQAYAALKSLFDQTKKLYSKDYSFLYPDELGMEECKHRDILHATNLATFLVSVFGGTDVGFYELNDNFLNIFAPDGQPLQIEQGQIFINLKTQMLVAAATSEGQDVATSETIETLFPQDLESELAARHPDTPLSDSEDEFIKSAWERRQYLTSMCSDIDSIQTISEEFTWEQFLLSISEYLRKVYEPMCAPYLKIHAVPVPKSPKTELLNSCNDQQTNGNYAVKSIEEDDDSLAVHANAAVQLVLQSMDFSSFQNSASDLQQQPADSQEDQAHELTPSPPNEILESYNIKLLPGKQSEPTAVLYERARQIAANKSTSKVGGKPGPPSQRRPWSSEEEAALMTGLDQVKGPHWSQILALYGPSGTINDVLKDRNQVQLKDKARNLKLFFLKSNIEVPHYLSQVTGELKTRAPSQAAKREMEDRQKLLEENQGSAQLDSIMALSKGLQNLDRDITDALSRTPTLSPFLSSINDEDDEEGPEQFEIVEPEEQEGIHNISEFQPSNQNETVTDETLRRHLIAATSGSIEV